MIIHWAYDHDFAGALENREFLLAASELLRAHRHGAHLLVLDRQVAGELLRLGLSAPDIALVRRLHSEFTQTGGLPPKSSAYAKIRNSFGGVAERNGAVLWLPLSLAADATTLHQPALLVENLSTDGWLYSMIFRATAEQTGRGSVSFELTHGGGDDISGVLQHLIEQKRMVCAIIDSDKNSPQSTASAKTSKLRKIVSNTTWPFASLEVLPCREAENLVPPDLVFRIPSGIGNPTNQFVTNVEMHEDSQGIRQDCYWWYFDVKDGIAPDRLAKLSEVDRQWVSMKLDEGGVVGDGWTLEGYGDRVIQQIASGGAFAAELRQAVKQNSWRSRFATFFDATCWFFVSSRRLIT